MPSLNSVVFDSLSFYRGCRAAFESIMSAMLILLDLTALTTLSIGGDCFRQSTLSLKGTSILLDLSVVLPSLKSLSFGGGSFERTSGTIIIAGKRPLYR